MAGAAVGDLALRLRALPPATASGSEGATDDRNRIVPLVLEVEGRDLVELGLRGTLRLEVLGYAVDAQGGVKDHFAQTLDLDLNVVGSRLSAGGLAFLGTFSLPEG